MIPLKDTIRHIGVPLITWSLIILNGIIFIFEISIPKGILEEIFYFFGLVPARYSSPKWALIHGLSPRDYFPFLSNMFLHGGWLHIIGNMWFLYLFGSSVEDRTGHVRFLILYILTGLAANILFFILDIHSMIPEFGASGAIAGVMGAYIVMFPRARILTLVPIFLFPLFFYVPAFFYLGFWFLIQLFSGTLTFTSHGTAGVAWWAHVGGFLAGMALILLLRKRGYLYRESFPDETYHLYR